MIMFLLQQFSYEEVCKLLFNFATLIVLKYICLRLACFIERDTYLDVYCNVHFCKFNRIEPVSLMYFILFRYRATSLWSERKRCCCLYKSQNLSFSAFCYFFMFQNRSVLSSDLLSVPENWISSDKSCRLGASESSIKTVTMGLSFSIHSIAQAHLLK